MSLESCRVGTQMPARIQATFLRGGPMSGNMFRKLIAAIFLFAVPAAAQTIAIRAVYLKESTAFRALHGLHNGEILLNAGFTTLREVGNEADYACSDLKKALHEGWFDGPTLECAGKIIGPFGGQSKGIPEEMGGYWLHEYIDADT